MNNVKIELNGIDLNQLAEKIETLTNALSGKKMENSSEAQNEKLLTRAEVSKLLGVTLPTIHDWTKKGLIVGYRIGNRIRYKQAEIMEKVTNNKTHY